MKPGDPKSMSVDELLLLDEQAPSAPAEPATYDDAFRVQQQKFERLNEYYDEVVAELRTLLAETADEGR